jgi:raffinose/stachyose/melibiose transport system substrate-binding protein
MLLSILLVAAFALSACGSAAPADEPAAPADQPAAPADEPAAPVDEPATDEKVTVTWWHIGTADQDTALYQSFADEYMAAHPDVTIEITVLENEAFKSKLATVMQSGEPPDLFHSWGGGVMNEYADAGLLRNITPELDADGGAWRSTLSPGPLGVYAYLGNNF